MLDSASTYRDDWVSALKSRGFTLDLFRFISEGNEALGQANYEALLLNCRLPDGDSIDWMRERRSMDQNTRFVIVTRLQDVEARIRALENGADDCVIETIDTRELVAKIRALLRRGPVNRSDLLEAGNLRLDPVSREAHVNGHALTIPRREFSLLEHFVVSFNRTLTREYLEMAFFGVSGDGCPNSFEVRISRLRRSLAQSGADVEIKTFRGVGYRLQRYET